MSAPKVAIIGAGMAGLACATELAKHGVQATIYDKGRGAGGRMATRRVDVDTRTLRFDHGTQYFTAHDSAFLMTIADWLRKRVVAPWLAAGESAYVGTPAMNAPLKHMASTLDVRWNDRVLAIGNEGGCWQVESENGTEVYSHVGIALPAEQTADLLVNAVPQFAAAAATSTSDPCWAVMAEFAAPLPIADDIVRDRTAAISWAARNNSKPERTTEECWVIHASPEHSREILELEKDVAAQQLIAQFFDQLGIAPVQPTYLTAHRWRFAQSARSQSNTDSNQAAMWDADTALGVAGDWLMQPRVEGAWLSGRALAEKMLGSS